jgi:hypothetical protein
MFKRSLLIVGLLVAAGCNHEIQQPIQPRQDVNYNGQIFLDGTEIRNDIAASQPIVTRDQAGLLHVTVPVRSVINRNLHTEWRAIFYNRDHQEIDRTPWQDKTLAANLPDQFSVTSTLPADGFEMHFRYPPSTEYKED